MNKTTTPVLECRSLVKSFRDGKSKITVLNNIDFTVMPGERLAIVGVSGSGKSTLLHLLGGLDKPTSGEILISGKNVQALSEKELSLTRNKTLGFVYQFHHLLPEFTVLENVCIPLLIRGNKPRDAIEKANVILKKVGLSKRLTHKVGELSGGEKQRTAIARALVLDPACVLADEPTGNLDAHTADQVYDTMLELNEELQMSLIVVTHDTNLASKMDETYVLEDGVLKSA